MTQAQTAASRRARGFTVAHDAVRSPTTAGFVVFLVVTLGWLAPLLPHFGSAVLEGQGDATNALRAYWAMEQAGKTPFTWSRDQLNGAPEGIPRPPAADFVSPVQSGFVWIVKPAVGRVAALNLFIALGFFLTSFAAFLLLSRLRFGFLPSLFGGYVVGFNPWMFDRAFSGHAAFLHGWVFILLLWTLVRLREERTARRAAVAGASYGLTFSIAAYFGLLATAIVGAFVIVDVLRARSRAERLWTFSLLSVIGVVASLFLVPGIVAFLLDRGTVVRSLTNPLDQLDKLAASPLSYIVPSPRQPLVGGVASAIRPDDPLEEKVLFFGYLTLALAAVAVLRRGTIHGRMRELVLLAVALVPVAFFASLPRSFELFGVDIPTPAYLIGEVTSFYRVYARFGYVAGIGLAILAAATLSRVAARRNGQKLVGLAIAVVVLELLVGRVTTYRIDVAPEHGRWLSAQPRGIVAHYPMPTDQPQALALAHTEITFQPLSTQPLYTIFGAGTGGTREDAIRILTRYVDDRVTPGILAAEHVRYVVLHDDVYRAQGERLPKVPPTLHPLATFGPVRIFELRAKPIDVDAALERNAETIAKLQGLLPASLQFTPAGFNDPEEYRPSEQWRWMTQAGQLRLQNPNRVPARFEIQGFAFSSREMRQLELTTDAGRVLARAQIPTYMVKVRLGPFRIGNGESLLSLRVAPGPTPLGGGDPRQGSIFVSPLRVSTLPDFSNSLRAR